MDTLTATLIFSAVSSLSLARTGFKTAAAIKRRNRQHILFNLYATLILFIVSVAVPLMARIRDAGFEIDLRLTIPATIIGYIIGIAAGTWLTPPRKPDDDYRPDSDSDSPVQPPTPSMDTTLTR